MELSPYVESLQRELASAAETGGAEARALAERLTAPLDAAIRLTLIEALAAAADEITLELAPGSVELRLRTGEMSFAVNPAPADNPLPPEPDDSATARINLRLPEQLKAGIEAAASRERLSVNSWLVRVLAAAVGRDDRAVPPSRGGRVGQSYTGWVR